MHVKALLFAIAVGLVLTIAGCGSVWFGPKTSLDFSRLSRTTTVVVCRRACPTDRIKTLSDFAEIHDVVQFVQLRSDAWREAANGPGGGELNFIFLNDSGTLGTFGLTRTGSRDDVASVGTMMRAIAHEDSNALLNRIGVSWP